MKKTSSFMINPNSPDDDQYNSQINYHKQQPQTKSSFNKSHLSAMSNNEHQYAEQSNNNKHCQDHSLLMQILQKNKRKTVQHHVNIINPQSTQLYKQYHKSQHNIKTQQTNNNKSQTRYDKKLNQLYYKIKHQFNNLSQINKKSHQFQNIKIKRSISLKNQHHNNDDVINQNNDDDQKIKQQTNNKSEIFTGRKRQKRKPNNRMINTSGVVSYKFKSLLAQKNLVYDKLNNRSTQQKLYTSLQNIKYKSMCPIQRDNKIFYKSVGKKHKQPRQKFIAFKQNLVNQQDKELSTDRYLQKVVDNKKNIEKVYGEEESKLGHVRYLMNQLDFERQVAQYSADNIVQKIKEQSNLYKLNNIESNDTNNLPIRKSTIQRDQKLLRQRIKISYKPKRSKNLNHNNKNNRKQIITNKSAIILTHLNFISDY